MSRKREGDGKRKGKREREGVRERDTERERGEGGKFSEELQYIIYMFIKKHN